MKKLFIETYNDFIEKFYLLDIEKEIQYVGAKKIGSYKESLNQSLINRSFDISEEKFNLFLNLKFNNLTKISYKEIMEELELQEFLI